MRDIKETPEKITFRYQFMATLRDVITISAVISLFTGAMWMLTKPHLEPWLALPEEIAAINARLAPLASPQVVEFRGRAAVVNTAPVSPATTLRLLYFLKRNAGCETDIERTFINVDTGGRFYDGRYPAVQAPVTDDFNYFILELELPNNIEEGRYMYAPRIYPKNCGIYQAYNGALSEVFTVERAR